MSWPGPSAGPRSSPASRSHLELPGCGPLAALGRGVLLNGVRPDVVRMMPPLTITAEEVDEGVNRLEATLNEIAAR